MFEGRKKWFGVNKSKEVGLPTTKQETIKILQIPFDKIDTTDIQYKVSEISTKAYDFSKPDDINAAQKDWESICNFIEKYDIYKTLWEIFYDMQIKGSEIDYVILDEYGESELRSDWYEDNSFDYFTHTIRDYSHSPINCVAFTLEPSEKLYDEKFKFEKLDHAYNIIQSFFDRINENKGKNEV